MKPLLIVTFLFVALGAASAQRVATVGDSESVTIAVKGGDYLVEQDTAAGGVITIRLIPSEALRKDIESKLGSVETEDADIREQIDGLQTRLQQLGGLRKELLAILERIAPASDK